MPIRKGRRHLLSTFTCHGDITSRPFPTPELLKLYTKMRDLEKDIGFEELLQLHDDPIAQPTHHLLPPTPGATSMSRSTSCKSSNSASRALRTPGGTETADEHMTDTKRKNGRHGPLSQFVKARTAFMRKLRVCDICRARKVKCTHHDLSLFELEYNRARGAEMDTHKEAPEQTAGENRAGLRESALIDSDLLGIGLAPTPLVEANRTMVDFDQLLPSSSPTVGGELPNLSIISGRLGTGNSYFLEDFRGPSVSSESTVVPVGREVDSGVEGWECRGASVSTREATCLRRFPRLADLNLHYRQTHSPFREMTPPYLYMCTACECYNDIRSSCIQCESPEDALERWYMGYVNQKTPSASAAEGEVTRIHGPPSDFSSPYSGPEGSEAHVFGLGTLFSPNSWFGGPTSNNFASSPTMDGCQLSGRLALPLPQSLMCPLVDSSLTQIWPAFVGLHCYLLDRAFKYAKEPSLLSCMSGYAEAHLPRSSVWVAIAALFPGLWLLLVALLRIVAVAMTVSTAWLFNGTSSQRHQGNDSRKLSSLVMSSPR